MVYFIKYKVDNGFNFKVGFAKDVRQRACQYYTHNPSAQLVEYVTTYQKTKHQLETAIHNELRHMGMEFLVAQDGRTTEWFFLENEKAVEFEKKGLAQFKACKGRKIHKGEELF